MLKTVMYYFLLLTTAVRFVDVIYLLALEGTNLPVPVLLVTTAMIIYGFVLVVKRFIGNIRFKQLMMFYMLQSVMIAFNLTYIAVAYPLQVGLLETLAMGTFLDLLINASVLYMSAKQMRGGYVTVQQWF